MDLRIVQAFLSRRGLAVFSVSYDVARAELLCDCPGFEARTRCKHVAWVMEQTVNTGGRFNIRVPNHVTLDARDPVQYRELVLRYGTPAVL